MKFSCVQNKITQAIGQAGVTVGKQVDLQVLSCLLATANKNNELTLYTTDIETATKVTIPAQVAEEGTVAIKAETISRFISSLPKGEEPIVCSKEGELIHIHSKGVEANIATLDHKDFPSMPDITKDALSFPLALRTLLGGLKTVGFCASVSNIKPELSSVFVRKEGKKLFFASTDAWRLAEKVFSVEQESIPDFEILLPVKSANSLLRIFEQVDESREAVVYITESQLMVEVGGVSFTSRLVQGNFPDYNQLIPKDKETSAVVLKQDLQDVLKLTSIFSDDFHEVLIELDPKNKIFNITSENKSVGNNTSSVPGALEGEEVHMRFNHKYIQDCLHAIASDSLELILNGPGKPLTIMAVPKDGFTYIVMPLNK